MNAAKSGFRRPKAANPTPIPSTMSVPAKLNMMMLWHRCAIFSVSTSFKRSLVDERVARNDLAVNGNPAARLHDDNIANVHLLGTR